MCKTMSSTLPNLLYYDKLGAGFSGKMNFSNINKCLLLGLRYAAATVFSSGEIAPSYGQFKAGGWYCEEIRKFRLKIYE